MAVITISRQFGSGGEEITQRVCELLGYRLFNKRMVEEAAREVGLTGSQVIDLSEENHQVRSFLDRMFTTATVGHYTGMWPEDIAVMQSAEEQRLQEENALQLVRKAIWRAYHEGSVVIVGRGGQMVLRDSPNVLHVRIEAPMEARIQRLQEAMRQTGQIKDQDLRRAAKEQIQDKDRISADYIKRFYDEDWANPLLYHVLINTGKLSATHAVRLITTAASWI